MAKRIHWIRDARILAEAPVAGEAAEGDAAQAERRLLAREGLVKVEEGEEGTIIRCCMFSRNWSSLFFVAEWLHGTLGPWQLQYYSAGWFNERHVEARSAADRIQHLIHKSDVILSQSVYIAKVPETGRDVPGVLKRALKHRAADEDCSVDCVFDASTGRFRVARVGPRSTIARLWGQSPACYPCLSGHHYDEAVSRAYPAVARSGEPHYDHVYAAMASMRGDTVWVPYQRVVLPLELGSRHGHHRRGVRIVTELAQVAISPL